MGVPAKLQKSLDSGKVDLYRSRREDNRTTPYP